MAEVAITIKKGDNTQGLYKKLPDATVADGVLTFAAADGTKSELIEKFGPFRARHMKVIPGSDMTSRLNTIFAHASVSEVIIDHGDIIINGTLTIPSTKKLVFQNTGAITGTGTISGGIIEADFHANIFKGTVLVRPTKLSNREWSVKWFGATGNGTTNDQPAIQRCIEAGTASGIHNWYFPAGRYNCYKGLLFRKDNGSGDPVFLLNATIRGEGKAYAENSIINHTLIIVAADSFGIGIDRGKGVWVDGIGFDGQNNAPNSLSLKQICEDNTPGLWTTPGVRDDSWSPHAGIVIDPFTSASQAAANPTKVYPGFSAYYRDTAAGGSTDIKVTNCYGRKLVVGFCITPHPTPQNGDHIEMRDCWSEQNKVGFSLGQSQNRTISFTRIGCWGNTETVFDCRRYGDGSSGTCEVTNCNIAGGVKYLVRIPGFDQNNGFIIRDCHAELLWAIGGSFGDGADQQRAGQCKIYTSFLNLMGPSPYWAYNERGAPTIYKGNILTLNETIILCLQGPAARVFNIDAITTNLNNVVFETPMTFGTINGQNCVVNMTNVRLGYTWMNNTQHLNPPFYTSEYSDKQTAVVGSLTYTESLSTFWAERKATSLPIQRGTGLRRVQPGYLQWGVGTGTFTALDEPTQVGTLHFTSANWSAIWAGAFLYSEVYNQHGDMIWGHVATVTSVDSATGNVGVEYVSRPGTATPGVFTNFALGTPYNFYVHRLPLHYYPTIIGNVTAGSTVITNVDMNTNGYFYPSGCFVDSPYFPPWTYITGWDRATKTMYVSQGAYGTTNDLLIQDIRVKREMYYSGDPVSTSIDAMGWQEGDVVYNNGLGDANVLRWECTKSGLGGAEQASGPSTRYSTWKPVYKVEPAGGGSTKDPFTLAADGSRVVPLGSLVTRIVVKPSAAIAGFKIGITAGGEEIMSAQPLLSGQWATIPVDKYDSAAQTFYFGGITSSTDIIIYYE